MVNKGNQMEGEGSLELGEHLMREAISGHQRQSDEGEGSLELGEHLMREAISGHQRQSDEGEGSLELGEHLIVAGLGGLMCLLLPGNACLDRTARGGACLLPPHVALGFEQCDRRRSCS